ncbi:hypothetical protein FSW04_07825 [Baekduia soli]|uniref:Uncharacterized protein n=1 Tax=Baekduia soli TaxID=496014 RepID=A0A5B8U3E4_9ACTN|nr:hypothetical protein [Baekduia soli]QEC47493.1 hypothetical protein FSW04_07825 [Baekduia soli]
MSPTTAAAVLQERLGLSDDELLGVLDADPLSVVGGELDHKPQLPILLTLTAEAAERAGEGVLRRWVRSTGRAGRPIDLLLARDYGAFEDALEDLRERGFVVRAGGGR